MKYSLIKGREKATAIREFLGQKYKDSPPRDGEMVSYSMPSLPRPLAGLMNAIKTANTSSAFAEQYYYIQTDHGHVQRFIPLGVYPRQVIDFLHDKLYSASVSSSRIHSLCADIRCRYTGSRSVSPHTGQPGFMVSEEVRMLKTELGAFLFATRSILDHLVTLMHYLYGHEGVRYNSFTKFIKGMVREPISTRPVDDLPMTDYLQKNMDWFWLLRDIRDFVTHCGSLEINFFESTNKRLSIYFAYYFELEPFVNDTMNGITVYLEYCDRHFSGRITAVQGPTQA